MYCDSVSLVAINIITGLDDWTIATGLDCWNSCWTDLDVGWNTTLMKLAQQLYSSVHIHSSLIPGSRDPYR